MIGLGMIFSSAQSSMGNLLFNIGVLAFVIVLLFHVITLPVEFNASSRALKQMESCGVLGESDMAGARKVLRAAAMTYVAATAVAAANLLRILMIRNRD